MNGKYKHISEPVIQPVNIEDIAKLMPRYTASSRSQFVESYLGVKLSPGQRLLIDNSVYGKF